MEEPHPSAPQPPQSPQLPPPSHSRRALGKLVVLSATGAAAGSGLSAALTHIGHAVPPPYHFFSQSEANLLIAICEQFIPRDDEPGATDAGVIHYIDRQLKGPLARHQQAYQLGLEAFGKTCNQVFGTPFERLPFEKQSEALRLIESGRAPKELWESLSQQEFFNLVLDHAMQGFYGSPRHGGNRNYTSYRMLGLAYPNGIGRNSYATKQP